MQFIQSGTLYGMYKSTIIKYLEIKAKKKMLFRCYVRGQFPLFKGQIQTLITNLLNVKQICIIFKENSLKDVH